MTKTTLNPDSSKTKGRAILEYVLLVLCLSVIALRTMITESPTNPSTSMPINITSSLHSLSISTVLFLAFIIWLVLSVCSKRFSYRLTGMETGLYIFIIAAVIAFFAASDKRAAITNLAIFFAPLLCAVLLVQLLDSPSKIKLLFVVIAALGVVTAHQAAKQFFSSNQIMIEQYQQSPNTMLTPLDIRPGTLAHMLFEHRLYSKDVRA